MALLAVVAACDDGVQPPVLPTGAVPSIAPGPSEPSSIDQWFAAVADQVEGFGGAFFDSAGVLNVYLTDPDREDAARVALTPILTSDRVVGPNGRKPTGEMRVLRGDFGFDALYEWRNRTHGSVLALDGVTSLDIDESRNRIVVGIEAGFDSATVVAETQTLGVPDDAVIVEEKEPTYFAATLRDERRPVHGGLQIAFSGYVCTLGFNAYRNDLRSFVTAAHCTDIQGEVESTDHYQPSTSSSSHLIGVEYADPPFFTSSETSKCPDGRRCRYSDAALSEYDADVESYDGRIGRTTAADSLERRVNFLL